MSTLFGNNISQTYQGLIKLANSTTGVTATTQSLQDGLGNNIPIQVSNTTVNISGSFLVNGQPVSIETGSFATTGSNTFIGNQTITGSVNVTGTITANSASFNYLETIYETASIIYSSGSNQFGDASNDTQTLWGTIKIPTGPVDITGSLYVSSSVQKDVIVDGQIWVSSSLTTATTSTTQPQVNVAGYTSATNRGSTQIIPGRMTLFQSSSNTGEGNVIISRNGFNLFNNNTLQNQFYAQGIGSSNTMNYFEYKGIYNLDGTIDIEQELEITSSGSLFRDWNNSVFDYSTYMSLAPNNGDNPAPQFTRGLGVNGNTIITGSVKIAAPTNFGHTASLVIGAFNNNNAAANITGSVGVSGSVNVTGSIMLNGVAIVNSDRNGLITTGSVSADQTIGGQLRISGSSNQALQIGTGYNTTKIAGLGTNPFFYRNTDNYNTVLGNVEAVNSDSWTTGSEKNMLFTGFYLAFTSGSGNSVISGRGSSFQSGSDNVVIGNFGNLLSGNQNTYIGSVSNNPTTESNTLRIAAGNSTILTKSGSLPLQINGDVEVTGSIDITGNYYVNGVPFTGGSSGTSGTSGSNGSDGTSGSNGSSGTSGVSGTDGTSGTSGGTGSSGTSGSNGTDGSSGTSGGTGSSGTSGSNGTDGSSGTSGVAGSSGTSGTSGSNGTSGTSFSWKGDFNNASGYSVNDVVSYLGSSYICILSSFPYNPFHTPPNPVYWNLLSQAGSNGTSGTSGGSGSSGTSGTSGTSPSIVGAGLITTGSIATTQSITGSLIHSGSGIFTGSLASSGSNVLRGVNQITGSNTLDGITRVTGSLLISNPAIVVMSGSIAMSGSNTLRGATTITGSNTLQGSTTITGSINLQGSTLITGSLSFDTGSVGITGSVLISGSVKGIVNSLTITSNTASLNLNNGNFFTLILPTAVDTFVSASNITPGQTINLVVSNGGTGTITFSNNIKQPSGSFYVPTTGATAVDIVSLISVDGSNLYMNNVKNFI